jgi:hypothetical protein
MKFKKLEINKPKSLTIKKLSENISLRSIARSTAKTKSTIDSACTCVFGLAFRVTPLTRGSW